MRIRSAALFGSLLAACLAAGVTANDQKPTFRASIDVVVLDVAVTDERGRPVTDLDSAEFEVYEGRQRRRIVQVRSVNLPVVAAGEALPSTSPAFSIPPDVVHAEPEGLGRTYALIFDDLNADPVHGERMRAAGVEFVERYLQPGDRGLIAYVSGRPDVPETFSSDPGVLRSRIRLSAGSQFLTGSSEQEVRNQYVIHKTFTARGLLDTLDKVIGVLAAVPAARKALVLFTEGFPLGDQPAAPILLPGAVRELCL